MATQLGAASTIVEIGCGSGGGTITLSKRADRVISIEANERLANIARVNLISSGASTRIVTLEEIINKAVPSDKKVTIINANVFDERLTPLLNSLSLDAVVCWLIGAAGDLISEQLGKSLELFTGPEMPEYRNRVHKRCYELGASILKQNGVVHIIDRIALHSCTQKDLALARDGLMSHHHEISSGKYTFTRENTFLKRVERSFATSNIQYPVPPGTVPSAVIALSSVKGIFREL